MNKVTHTNNIVNKRQQQHQQNYKNKRHKARKTS